VPLIIIDQVGLSAKASGVGGWALNLPVYSTTFISKPGPDLKKSAFEYEPELREWKSGLALSTQGE
jgi:hypothetical protein